MKRIAVIAGLTAWLSALAMVALAQGPRGGRHWYDSKSEVTIHGVVEKVDRVNYPHARGTGIRLTVKSDTETYAVRVGPASFVEKTMTFKDGDKVQILGSSVMMREKPMVIAREIQKDGKTLTLRDKNGYPAWRGMRTTPFS
jgi:hypothetical protein